MEKKDKIVREHLLELLKGGNAHMTLNEAVKDFPEKEMNTKFPNGNYSPWHLLEHIRLTQADILEFIVSDHYTEKDWPKDYWPQKDKKGTEKDWNNTLAAINKDTKELERLVKDPKSNLYTKLPNGTGQTLLREILLVTDHNAYHIGEFAIMRQTMGTWGKRHDE